MDRKKVFTDYYSNPEWRKKYLEQATTKVKCICGGMHMKSNKSNHYKTKTHLLQLQLKQAKNY